MGGESASRLTPTDQVRVETLLANGSRVQSVVLESGQTAWIKQVERLSGRLRWQKGDPGAALNAERQGLHVLKRHQIPVPEILAEGPRFVVLADAGHDLETHLSDLGLSGADASQVLRSVGDILARLHRAGFAHGRPALRDFCWDGETVRMIDLERFSNRQKRPLAQAVDLFVFVQTWFSRRNPGRSAPELLDQMVDSYRKTAPSQVWPALRTVTRLLFLLKPLLWLGEQLRPNSREVTAALRTVNYLAGLTS